MSSNYCHFALTPATARSHQLPRACIHFEAALLEQEGRERTLREPRAPSTVALHQLDDLELSRMAFELPTNHPERANTNRSAERALNSFGGESAHKRPDGFVDRLLSAVSRLWLVFF